MRKMRKPDQKTTSLRLKGWNGAEKWTERHIYNLLLHVLTQFQLPSSVWRGDRRGRALFQGQKRWNPYISSSNWLWRLIFRYVFQLLIFYWLAKTGAKFCVSDPSATPSQIGTWLNSDPSSSPLIYRYI